MIETIFWTSLALIIYQYVSYPIILGAMALILGKKVEKGDLLPEVTLIISAYNEEEVMEEKIKNTLALDYPKDKLEIVVASEATDGTNEIVKKYADRGVKLFTFEDREGKAATLFRSVPKTKGEILVFSDANATYTKEAIKKLVRNFADKNVGCVSGRLCYKNSQNSTSGKGEIYYWNYETFLKKVCSRLFIQNGVNGSIFALRREAYLPLSKYRGDDFELPINAAIHGYGVVFEPDAVSYEEVSETFNQEFKRKVRVASWNFRSGLILLSEALKRGRLFVAFHLVSHRMLRWCIPLFLISVFISNLFLVTNDNRVYLLVFIIQDVFYVTAAISFFMDRVFSKKSQKLLFLPYYFCMVNYASLRGVFGAIFRKAEIVWEKNR